MSLEIKRDILSIFQDAVTTVNIQVLNNRASEYMKQKLKELREEIENSKIIVGHFNTPLSITHRSTRQKMKREMEDMNNITNQ